MFIAVKEDDKFKVGFTIKENNIDSADEDMLLEDNLPVWKLRGKPGVLICCANTGFAASVLKYEKELFKFNICDEEVFGGFAIRLRNYLDSIDLLDSDGCWQNELLIINKNVAYHINGYFSISKYDDVCVSNANSKIIIGSLTNSIGEPADQRIVKAFRLINSMRHDDVFPISVFDSSNGKRKIFSK